jgi:putative ABC transport system permease protein
VFLLVRSNLTVAQATAAMRGVVRAVAPDLPLRADQAAMSMDEQISDSLAGPRFLAALSTAFSATALLLSALGVFGLVAYSVAQRRRELGIRAALGARPRDLALQTISAVALLSCGGILTGSAAAAYLTRFVETQLYAVEPLDAPTFIGAAAVMLLVSLLAAAVPTQRAAAVAPMSVLREE